MEMFLSQEDVAIKFNGLYRKVLRMIDSLEEADIDVKNDRQEVEKTKTQCDQKAKKSPNVS